MKTLIQWLLLVLFVTLILMVLIPSGVILSGIRSDVQVALQPPPSPPNPPNPLVLPALDPKLDLDGQVKAYTQQVNAFTQQVSAYAQQVNAYTQHISAYKTFVELTGKSRQASVYDLVVKNTLLSLLSSFVTFFLGYVFIKAGVNVLGNFIRAKSNQPLERFKLL